MPQNLDQAVQNAYSDLYAAFAAKAAKDIDQARPGNYWTCYWISGQVRYRLP